MSATAQMSSSLVKGYLELKRAGTRIWNSPSRRAVRSAGEIAISDSQVGGARTRDHEDKARGLMRRDLALTETK
jgi:hypothetical protein